MYKDLNKEVVEIIYLFIYNNSRKGIDIHNKSTFVSNTVLKECTNMPFLVGRLQCSMTKHFKIC